MAQETVQNKDRALDEILAPSAVSIASNYIQIGDKFARTLAVSTYPRYLNTGWFSPIINLDRELDASIFIHPQDSGFILKKLRDRLTRLEAQAIEDQTAGKVRDPILDTAISDIEALRDKLQQGTDRFFEVGLYVTIYGNSLKELDELEGTIKGILDAQLIYYKQATFRMREGFTSTLPLSSDQLYIHTSLNTEPASSLFPFTSFDLTSNDGILYGINNHNNSLVLFDRFSLQNANTLVFGQSGGGKSILGSEPVLIKNDEQIQMAEIGPLIEKIIAERGADRIDDELEGVISPGIKVWAFDRNLRGSWSNVTVAARKAAPGSFFKFTTKSGRIITTTGDHNLVTLQEGQVIVAKSSEIKKGRYLPLPRQVECILNQSEQFVNLLDALKNSKGVYLAGASKLISDNYSKLKTTTIDTNYDRYLYKYRAGRVVPITYLTKIFNLLRIDLTDGVLNNLKIVSRLQRSSLPIRWPITAQFIKLLGYIVSEGTITQNAILISNIDQEILNDIGFALKTIGVQFFFGNRGVVIADRIFVEIIKSLCGERKSGTKIVPPFIFNLDKALVAAFIQAYFEGDGGVEHSSVTAISKSRQLVSELSYLMYYFGIVARIKKVRKKAPDWNQKKSYWLLSVSGQANLKKFATQISFVSQRKRGLLAQISNKLENTNVDLIPGLQPIFEEIYRLIPFKLHDFQELSALKRGRYSPSPEQLQKVVEKIEDKIATFKNYGSRFRSLDLPSLEYIIETGGRSRELNRELWQALGGSWRLTKSRKVQPRARNMLKALIILDKKFTYSLQEIKNAVHFGFKELCLSLKHFQPSLEAALTGRFANTDYGMLWNAGQYVAQKYQEKLAALPRIEHLLARLKVLAKNDLFWDPIEKIEKIKNVEEKYVYDLTVDNEVFLAGQGGMFVHNSYSIKLEILRSLMFGTQILVIDPEDEYKYLAEAVGGTVVKVSVSSDSHINPFDLPKPRPDETPSDVLREHALNLGGLLELMFGQLTQEEKSLLDEAIIQTYALKDITSASVNFNSQMPTLSDLQSILEGMSGTGSLVNRIKSYTEGSFAGFLNNYTNVNLNAQLVVFSIRDMQEGLKPLAMYLVLNYIWAQIRTELKKRILAVDEAWLLLANSAGGKFLFDIAKRARKYFLGLTTISQEVNDMLNSPFGKPLLANSSIKLLFNQNESAIKAVQETFNLTEAEKFFLLRAPIGQGLFFAGNNHVALRVVASYAEDQLISSDPRHLLEIQEAKKELAG